MEHLTTTPFGRRPVTADLIDRAAAAQARPSVPHINKWELFRELCAARIAFGVSDRDLTVLNALLSFHQDATLSDNANLIVFPSNAALSERAHGMAESTLRRHLAALVAAGLILRHDSPNGKRYAARDMDGDVTRAFGFDLRPLLVRAREITSCAAEARAAAERLKRLREAVSLKKRDALKLVEYGRETGLAGDWEGFAARLLEIHKRMRRKLAFEVLEELGGKLGQLLLEIRETLSESKEVSGSDVDSGRQYQNSNKDSHDSELCQEEAKGGAVEDPEAEAPPKPEAPHIPLGLVLKACPDILDYTPDKPRHWHELVALAAFVRGMMGISPDAWDEAQRIMGPEVAAVTVAAILQRVSDIRSPGGYLRALTGKAAAGGFSPGPMVMALLTRESADAA
ncbi:plasmid replication protein RepC [Acidimangrovimonas pyrenivorans]|uniref:Plasmid replication protein RepC n=1 Tax=Acidimangrovimonas pyrenivorans TaxID=2030798 RepID=A0ABV7AM95_9RHOB